MNSTRGTHDPFLKILVAVEGIGVLQRRYQRVPLATIVDSKTVRLVQESLGKGLPVPLDVSKAICETLGIPKPKDLVFVSTWEDLVKTTIDLLQGTKREAYLASRYFDIRISIEGLRAAASGCRIHSLHSGRINHSTSKDIIEIEAKDPRAAGIFKSLAKNPNVTMEEAGLAFSFMVIDFNKVGIEIIDPSNPEKFFAALSFDNPEFAERLVNYFKDIEHFAMSDRRKNGGAASHGIANNFFRTFLRKT